MRIKNGDPYRPGPMLFLSRKRADFPTLLHITHAKAGSTWIEGILRALFGKQVRGRGYAIPDFVSAKEKVFSVFMTREEVLTRPELEPAKRFIVLRDLRDTLISRYFSLRASHELDSAGKIAAQRAELCALSIEDGLAKVMEDAGMAASARIQRSWFGSGEVVLRYEDLLADDVALFRRLFLEQLALPLTPARIEKAVVANRFEKLFRRQLGVEDTASHGRKGTPGDWRNHFTPRLADRFHELYGELLLAGHYEADERWPGRLTV